MTEFTVSRLGNYIVHHKVGNDQYWHRPDGPACQHVDGSDTNGWWYKDRVFGSEDFDESWPDEKKIWWMMAKLSGAEE